MSSFFFLYSGDEEKKMLGSNEGKKWLTDNKFMIETVKEVDKPITAEAVTNFISKNQSLSDKIYNESAIKFLKSKLGDKVTSDDLGKEIVFKMPENCPVCNSKLVKEQVDYRCVNEECPAIKMQKIMAMIIRNSSSLMRLLKCQNSIKPAYDQTSSYSIQSAQAVKKKY